MVKTGDIIKLIDCKETPIIYDKADFKNGIYKLEYPKFLINFEGEIVNIEWVREIYDKSLSCRPCSADNIESIYRMMFYYFVNKMIEYKIEDIYNVSNEKYYILNPVQNEIKDLIKGIVISNGLKYPIICGKENMNKILELYN